MHTYYLDTNALQYCLGDPLLPGWSAAGAAVLRDRIRTSLDDEQIEILGSQFHVEEFSRIGSTEARRQILDYFWKTIGWLLLMPTYDLTKAEAAFKGRLEVPECFETAWDRQTIKQICRNEDKLSKLADDVKAFVDRGVNDLRARKEAVTTRLETQFAAKTPQEITREWWAMAPNNIDSWVTEYMRASKEHLSLGDNETAWPTPSSQQTAWATHAYALARVFMNVGLNRRIGDGDVHDSHHFAAACYAQTFVTQDGVFRETLAQIPNLPVEVLDFNQFVQRLGVNPH